jgi:hypothetical protein
MMKLYEDRGQHVHQDLPLHHESETSLHYDMVVTKISTTLSVHRLKKIAE